MSWVDWDWGGFGGVFIKGFGCLCVNLGLCAFGYLCIFGWIDFLSLREFTKETSFCLFRVAIRGNLCLL